MNKDNAKDYLPLVQALADGKTIQGRARAIGEWHDFEDGEEVDFTDATRCYRIKPEPREFWIHIDDNNSVNCAYKSFGESPARVDVVKFREVTE